MKKLEYTSVYLNLQWSRHDQSKEKYVHFSWICVIQLNDELAVAASALKTIEQSGWTQIKSPPVEYGGNLKAILPTTVAW